MVFRNKKFGKLNVLMVAHATINEKKETGLSTFISWHIWRAVVLRRRSNNTIVFDMIFRDKHSQN